MADNLKQQTDHEACVTSTIRFPDHPPRLITQYWWGQFDPVTAAIAEGKRPAPFRTRKLSPPAPMVLHPLGCGRVGHRRTPFEGGAHHQVCPSFEGCSAVSYSPTP